MNAIEKALRVASRQVDRNPTDGQIESGNYRKGHVTISGLDITIENPKGSQRSGIDKNGKRWTVKMPCIYGYLKGTKGSDGDHVDCYVGQDHHSDKVWIIDQVDASTGKFDEHKCFLDFASKDAVLNDYEKAFSDGRAKDRIGAIRELNVDAFKSWLRHSDTTKPIADTKGFATGGSVHGDARMPSSNDLARKHAQAIALALSVARRGKADGGAIADTPGLGPLGAGLEASIRYAPKSTAAALARLSSANTFPDLVASNPHGWGRALPDRGSITADTPPSALEKALAIGEMPARAYVDQFGRATGAVSDAMGDPSLENLTNAGVQTGMAVGSPALTLGSGALGLGLAGAQDLLPYAVSGAEAKNRKHSVQQDLKPSIIDGASPAPFQHDPIGDKIAASGDPQLQLLWGAYQDAMSRAGGDVGGARISKESGDKARAAASAQAQNIMAQISSALEKKAQSERDLKQGNYNQQVEEANAARDLEMGRGRRFSDTAIGKVYDKMGGLAPMVMGMIPGAVTNLARGPAEGLGEKALRGGLGAISGVMANNIPLAYNAFSTPVENPEQRAAAAYSFNLPDGHPDKAKYEALANSLPKTNPTRDLAADELYNPTKFGERAVQGGLEGYLGSHLGEMMPSALKTIPEAMGRGAGAIVKPETYGFTGDYALQKAKDAALLQSAKRSAAADAAVDITPPSTGPRLEVSRPPASGSLAPSGSPYDAGPIQDLPSSSIPMPSRAPAQEAALNVAKRQSETAANSPVFSPDDLVSDAGSKLLKEFKKDGVRRFQEGDKVVHRVAPGRPEAGQYTSAPKRGGKSKAESSTTGKDSATSNAPSTNDALIPPPPANDTFAKGGMVRGVLELARKYANGGKVAIGPIVGNTGGRADAKNVSVPAGAYVIPADVVAGRGEGNTHAGQEYWAALEQHALRNAGGRVQLPARAMGGATSDVPIRIADGERVIPPHAVAAFGGGDMDHGHRVLDHLVKQFRTEDIHTLSNLPGPSK